LCWSLILSSFQYKAGSSELTQRTSAHFKKAYTQRKTHFNIVSGKEFTHFNIYYTQIIAQINRPCEKIIKFARVSSGSLSFAA
ncbi:MAG: hypothetical protein IKE47_01195, partial [Oscillospiraceae bacterium]|nr:hypothetical protein [Oscillospiraceae bacterium]